MSARVEGYLRRNVLGLVAIFIALGGTAIALPGRNTVKSNDIGPGQQIRNGDTKPIKGRWVADGSLTGADILESSLVGIDADELDGVDSTGFVKGTAAIALIDETITDPDGAGGAKGFSATVNVPGASIVAACLEQSNGIEMFLNKASDVASVRLWRDDGGANPTVKTLDPSTPGISDSDAAPVSAADRVIWQGSSSAGTFTAVLLTRYEGSSTCHWNGYVLKSG